MIVDAHLDLAYNAMLGRDLTLSLGALREQDPLTDRATVTFETLRRGGVGLCLGTLFAMPQDAAHPWGYEDWQGARAQAQRQLEQYLRWQDHGHVVLLTSGQEVVEHARRWSADTSPLGVVLLMEGADPLRAADDLPYWAGAGVRVIGPAWKRTRFAGGTGESGGLTERGEDLMVAMRELGVILDASHLAEEAFWQAINLQPKVIASHSNARAIVPTDRHLSADMLRAVAQLGGVTGCVLFNKFLRAGWERGDARLPLELVGEMLHHLAQEVGWDKVGLGSDLDGGFGVHELPRGLESAADLPRLAQLLPDEHREQVMGGNWLKWLGAQL
ncbi:dipeptidase [Deinococcus peraridilitoris]|nr:membrane dipeptidase [Deinococcus peraridilitoris]